MHILFATYEFVTEKKPCGGLGHYIANISSILAERGHQVIVLVVTDHESSFEWKENVRVITCRFDHITGGNTLGKCIEYLTGLNVTKKLNRSIGINNKIKEIVKKHKVDIIQYCGDDNLLILYRIKSIPSVVRLSSFGAWKAQASELGTDMEDMSWLETWESKLFLYSLRKADAIYGPSKFVVSVVRDKLRRDVKVIESPCIINDNAVPEECDNELQGKKYFLYFGKICILKGAIVIKRAIHDILEKNPDSLFVFVGREKEKNMIQSISRAAGEHKDRAIFLDEIRDTDKLYPIIKGAHAVVLPSRADNLPNTCIESMGLGKIVIGTYGASYDQLIKNKKNGLLIKRDSPKALIKAVDYLMAMTDEERLDMEQKAKERVAQMSPDIIYEQLISFYQDAIERKKKRLF